METIPHRPYPSGELAKALAKAQAEIKAPIKNRHVDFQPAGKARVKYSYADLADVIEAVKGPLSKNGLAVIHQLEYSDAGYGLKTSLIHESGSWIETWYPLPDPIKQSIRAQEFGSALTYARRYSLSSIVGIASEEDDDGAAAAPTQPRTTAPAANGDGVPKEFSEAKARREKLEREAQALSKGPSSPPPETADPNFDDEPPVTLLDQLVALVDAKGIPHDEMKKIIKMATGQAKRSTELSDDELKVVMKYVNLTWSK